MLMAYLSAKKHSIVVYSKDLLVVENQIPKLEILVNNSPSVQFFCEVVDSVCQTLKSFFVIDCSPQSFPHVPTFNVLENKVCSPGSEPAPSIVPGHFDPAVAQVVVVYPTTCILCKTSPRTRGIKLLDDVNPALHLELGHTASPAPLEKKCGLFQLDSLMLSDKLLTHSQIKIGCPVPTPI
jgi:hypothetical protein